MISQLRIQNFRSHSDTTVQFKPGINIITGPNGSGKTSLIEAIYMAYVGKSWRSNFEDICRRANGATSEWWRADLLLDNKANRTIKYNHGDKQFVVDDKVYKRLPLRAKRPVVLFEPNDMQLLYGSPSRRRDFIDRFIAQIEPIHQTELNKFNRILKQRNNLIKQDYILPDELIVWDIQFSTLSSRISQRRRQMLKKIAAHLTDKYSEIANHLDRVNLNFVAGAPNSEEEILAILNNSRDTVTPIGAQKDDFKFIFNHKEAKNSASRGENRTILFALLGIMVDITRELRGDDVYVLLDDIDSELDAVHRRNLYAMSSFQANTIATTLDCGDGDFNRIQLG